MCGWTRTQTQDNVRDQSQPSALQVRALPQEHLFQQFLIEYPLSLISFCALPSSNLAFSQTYVHLI